ncbi:MAG: glycosyltransferase family 4 protein [Bacillota bacterium]
MGKIVIIGGYSKSLINFRGHLIKDLISAGNQVIAMAPETGVEQEIASLGARFESIPLHRTGTNPVKDLYLLFYLYKRLRSIKPEKVILYTIKPVIYGSLACVLARVPEIFSMITGLGYVFTQVSTNLLARIIRILYGLALKYNKRVFFQNPDDLNLFVTLGLIEEEKSVIINGSGVDLERFYYSEANIKPLSFLLIARLLKDKGIIEFVESAKIIKSKYPSVRFMLLGPTDTNPSAIPLTEVKKWEEEGIIEYLGKKIDVRPYIKNCSVYVLPSYREGTPRSVLEAMAMGRPIITTDTPGCRETVTDGDNGFLVPVKDYVSLAKKMEIFINNTEIINKMGNQSRIIAEEKYDVHKVNRVILREIGLEG